MAIATEDFVKQIETMSVLDLSNLVKALEEPLRRVGRGGCRSGGPGGRRRRGGGSGRGADRV